MPEQITAVLDRLAGRPERFDELKALLDDQDLRRQLLDYTEEFSRGSSRFAAKEEERRKFYAGLLEREFIRMDGGEATESGDAIDRQLSGIISALDDTMQTSDYELLMTFAKHLYFPLCVKGRWEEAAKLYQRILEISRCTGHSELELIAATHYGEILLGTGNFETARELLTRARDKAQELGLDNQKLYSQILGALGGISRWQGRFDEAIEFFESGLAIVRGLDHYPGISALLCNLANVLYTQGKYHEAEKKYEEALSIVEELGNKYSIAAIVHNLASVKYESGDLREARPMFERALRINRGMSNRSFASANLTQLGNLYKEMGNYAKSRKCHQEALELARAAGSRTAQAIGNANLGVIAYYCGQHHESRKMLLENLAEWEELGIPLYTALCHRELGTVALATGDLDQAATHCQDAQHLSRGVADKPGLLGALTLSARLCLRRRDHKGAADSLTEALNISSDAECPIVVILKSLQVCSWLLCSAGNFAEGLFIAKAVDVILDSSGYVREPHQQKAHVAALDRAMAALSVEVADGIISKAQGMTLDQLTDYALNALRELQAELGDGELGTGEISEQAGAP